MASYTSRVKEHLLIFDQFSFSSVMTTITSTLTKNIINWYRTINQNLSFGESSTIPIVNFEISRYLLKNKRGTLTIRGSDLFDRNRIVQRFSELNYLREVRTNSIGQFLMLSFTYRINKFGGNNNGIEIKMRK